MEELLIIVLQLVFEAGAVVWRIFGDEDALFVEGDGEEMSDIEQNWDGFVVGKFFQIETERLPLNGVVKRRPDAVSDVDLTDDVLLVGVKVEAFDG